MFFFYMAFIMSTGAPAKAGTLARGGGESDELSEDTLRAMEAAMSSAAKTLKTVPVHVQPHLAAAPAATKEAEGA